MGKKIKINENQVNLNNICDEQPCKTKNNEKSENKNNTNDTNYDNINYKEEIIKLNNKVNQLANIINSLQDNLENILSESIDGKIKEIIEQRMGRITRSNNNEEQPNVYLTKGGKRLTNEEIKELNSKYQPDIVHKIEDGKTDKEQYVIGEVKSKIRQNELPFFKNTSSLIGATAGALLGGIPGMSIGALLGDTIFNPKEKEIDIGINGIDRDFLVNNPIESYQDFVDRLKILNPNLTDKMIFKMSELLDFDYGDLKSYNDFLIEGYEELKKKLLEKEKIRNSIPYVSIDFDNYVLTNNLKEILKIRGISLEKLSELINVSRNTMTAIVSNKGTSAINMFKISMVLQLPIEKIFRYEPMMDKSIREVSELNMEDE